MNIQTAAYQLNRKIKPDEAARLLEQLYAQNPLPEYAKLYKFFVKPSSGKAKTATEWVFRAVGNDKTRSYLSLSYSDGTHLFATDGKRLHMVPTSLPKGFYDASGNPIERDDDFYPDCMRLINSAKPVREEDFQTFHVDDLELTNIPEGDKPVMYYSIKFGEKVYHYKKQFVDDVLNGEKVFKAGNMSNPEMRNPEPLFIQLDKDWVALVQGVRVLHP
jgi:hypothetical protein